MTIHIIIAGDEATRCAKIEEFLHILVRRDSLPLDIIVHSATYTDPFDNLDEIIRTMGQPEWSRPCIIALDIKYPTLPYGGITVVYDELVRNFAPDPIPAKFIVWYSVYLAEPGEDRDKVLAMAASRGVNHTIHSGVADDLMAAAKYLLELAKECAMPDDTDFLAGLA